MNRSKSIFKWVARVYRVFRLYNYPRKVSLESRFATPSLCKFNRRLPVRAYTRFRLHSLNIGIFRDWSRKQALGMGKRLEGGSVVCN